MTINSALTIFTSLADINTTLGRDSYRKMARVVGGIRAYGREKPISIIQIAESLSFSSALYLLRTANYPSLNAARLLAADFASISLPLYERYHPRCDAIKQAIDTARRFAQGEVGKAALGRAYKLALAAQQKTVIANEILSADYYAASAAAHACAPFARGGELVWECGDRASSALTRGEGHLHVSEAMGSVLEGNQAVYQMIAKRVTDDAQNDVPEWLGLYHNLIRAQVFRYLNDTCITEDRCERALIDVLRSHLEEQG